MFLLDYEKFCHSLFPNCFTILDDFSVVKFYNVEENLMDNEEVEIMNTSSNETNFDNESNIQPISNIVYDNGIVGEEQKCDNPMDGQSNFQMDGQSNFQKGIQYVIDEFNSLQLKYDSLQVKYDSLQSDYNKLKEDYNAVANEKRHLDYIVETMNNEKRTREVKLKEFMKSLEI